MEGSGGLASRALAGEQGMAMWRTRTGSMSGASAGLRLQQSPRDGQSQLRGLGPGSGSGSRYDSADSLDALAIERTPQSSGEVVKEVGREALLVVRLASTLLGYLGIGAPFCSTSKSPSVSSRRSPAPPPVFLLLVFLPGSPGVAPHPTPTSSSVSSACRPGAFHAVTSASSRSPSPSSKPRPFATLFNL